MTSRGRRCVLSDPPFLFSIFSRLTLSSSLTSFLRSQVNAFWSAASAESALARSSPTVHALLSEQVRPAIEPFRAWLEVAMKPLGEEASAAVEEGEEQEGEESAEEEKEGGREEVEQPLVA